MIVRNSYNVGSVSGDSQVGGLIGYSNFVRVQDEDVLLNCAWLTSSASNVVGYDDIENEAVATLAEINGGTDETDNTAFYTTDHPVYAQ